MTTPRMEEIVELVVNWEGTKAELGLKVKNKLTTLHQAHQQELWEIWESCVNNSFDDPTYGTVVKLSHLLIHLTPKDLTDKE